MSSKTAGILWQYCKTEPNNNITDSKSFEFKSKFLDNTNDAGIINTKIAASLKQVSNIWRTLEMYLINCEINLILTWSANFVISEGNSQATFKITDTKLYVPVATQDFTKLLQ